MTPPDCQLRPLVASDAARIAELIGDWDVVRWLSAPPYPYALADAQDFLGRVPEMMAEASWVRMDAIVIDDALAGLVGIDKREAGPNLGYWLGKAYWGRGIMTAAATRLTHDFFALSQEPVLLSGFFTGNAPSCAIQRRLGFVEARENAIFNRPHGKDLPNIDTRLTRVEFQRRMAAKV